MDLEQLAATGERRPIDRDVAIEPPGRNSAGSSTSGRFVAASTITVVGRAEAVHFAEDLIERLLAFIVPAAQARAALPADGVDFVDEQDGRRGWPGPFGTGRARGRRRRPRTTG